jgi:hypothetical protein
MPIQGEGTQASNELPQLLGAKEPASNAPELEHAIGGIKGMRIARQNPLQQWVQRPHRHKNPSDGRQQRRARDRSGPKGANRILNLS